MREFTERYGVALGVVLAVTMALAFLPGNAGNTSVSAGDGDLSSVGGTGAGDLTSGADAGLGVGSTGDGGTGAVGGGVGGTGAAVGGGAGGGGVAAGGQPQAGAPAKGVAFGTGPNCDAKGRQKGISYTMPPCANWTKGTNNGGATFRGVTATQIKVVRWLGQQDAATEATLKSAELSDDAPTIRANYDAIRRYANNHYETYGRELVFEDMNASGKSTDDSAMIADAIKIATEKKPFAVIEGNPAAGVPTKLATELAKRGVLCMCTTSLTAATYAEVPPLIFSSLPSADEYAQVAAEYAGKKLKNKPANRAGLGTQGNPRKFGLIFLDGAEGVVVPEGERIRKAVVAAFAAQGIQFAKVQNYNYNPGRNQADVTSLILGMKQQGVTTIVPFWDPLFPILITQEATKQAYFPEWMIVGTGLSDTTTAGRLYDQQQWTHAFGISPLWVTWATVARSAGFREYTHGCPECPRAGKLINIYRARINTLFRGVHMAGPTLTNDSFVQGMFSYPSTGGTPGQPKVFITRQAPTEIKDFTEVWYGANVGGPDERGNQGTGMVVKAKGGQRYSLGQWTSSDADVFTQNGAVTVSDNPPGGADPPHEEDGHKHATKCLSC